MNLHFTQMNLEGGTNGICGSTLDCSGGGDYVEVFDGRNADAPSLSGHLTGDVTDGTKDWIDPARQLATITDFDPSMP